MIIRLAHLCFYTDRIEEMLQFYRDVLGLPVQFVMERSDGSPFGWYFNLGETTFLEIFDREGAIAEWGGEAAKLEQVEFVNYRHFCIQVTNIEEMRSALIEKGLDVTDIAVGLDHSKQCWIKDPDGNSIELMEYTERSLQLAP